MSSLSLLPICLKCGAQCCRYGSPMVLPLEREAILQFCGEDPFLRKEDFYVIPQEPCPFLTQDNHCSIEPVKPVDCKTFPVATMVENGRIRFGVVEECPAKYLLTENYRTRSENLLKELTQKQQRDLAELNESQGIHVRQKSASFGLEVVLDMYGCDTALFTQDSISDYLKGVCEVIGTEMFGEPIFYSDDHNAKRLKVSAIMQFVDDSLLVIYALNTLGAAYINLISCEGIEPKRVEFFSKGFFKAEKATTRVLERK